MHEHTEQGLRQHLGRVEAPPELWERVRSGRSRPVARQSSLAWVAAAAVLLLSAGAWSLFEASTRPLELHSASASEVREWVLANSGLDVPLPAKPSSLVEILGASIDRAVATISYRVGELRATLLVSRSPSGGATDTPHSSAETASTWTMAGQSYTLALAGPGDLKTACLLCHNAHEAALY